ncbi:MAG: hypothetical protein WCS34_08195 [Bacteroidales bacterium]
MSKKYSLLVKGASGTHVLSRITSLFMKNQVIIDKLDYTNIKTDAAQFSIQAISDEKRMNSIVNQINNIIEINNVTVKYI